MGATPLVVEIKRHSLEDGPGIRSVVFFKGCPLRCIFCQNPETQEPAAEIAFSPAECILCGNCADACGEGAIDLDFTGRIRRDKCTRCGICAASCPGRGLRVIGSPYQVEELADILLRDTAFYRHSGGGVTISGGEATLHSGYLERLLKLLKVHGVHVALQTSGCFDYDIFRRTILPHIDIVYYDIKFADPGLHARYTGRSNHRIIGNCKRLLREEGVEVHPRIPLVPCITATRENLAAIVDLLCEAGAGDVSLLPYNPMGIEMAVSLGRPRPPVRERFSAPAEEECFHSFLQSQVQARQSIQGKNVFNSQEVRR